MSECFSALASLKSFNDRVFAVTDNVANQPNDGVSIIVPTFREKSNIRPLYLAVKAVFETSLAGRAWEMLFVDDNSDDGTADEVRCLSREDARVRLIHRFGRRGLSSAVVEGAFCSIHPYIVVMDGDLQHDPAYIPSLLTPLVEGAADVASASRFIEADGADGLSSKTRLKQSKVGNSLVRKVFGIDLTDPLTGFFATRRECVMSAAPHLSSMGFKILLDILVSSRRKLRTQEVPFKFSRRHSGESKLDNKVLYDFFLFFLDKKVPGVSLLSPRFISFGIVGGSGVFVHLVIMAMIVLAFTGAITGDLSSWQFSTAQLIAAVVAMIWNFSINNILTYRDKRLNGWRFVRGLVLFMLLSSIGLAANVGVATFIQSAYLLNWSVPALAGIIMGTVWNYVTTRRFVWKDKSVD